MREAWKLPPRLVFLFRRETSELRIRIDHVVPAICKWKDQRRICRGPGTSSLVANQGAAAWLWVLIARLRQNVLPFHSAGLPHVSFFLKTTEKSVAARHSFGETLSSFFCPGFGTSAGAWEHSREARRFPLLGAQPSGSGM